MTTKTDITSRSGCTALIRCGAGRLLDLENDAGMMKLDGESDEDFFKRVKEKTVGRSIRPCPLVHAWVEKWWCCNRCYALESAVDEEGNVLARGKGQAGIQEELDRMKRVSMRNGRRK